MIRSTKILCAAALALCSTVVWMPEEAHAGRRGGLAGSQLILDEDDVFVYPQHTSRYANMLSLEVGATPQQGNALLIAGSSDLAIGVVLHRNEGINAFPYTLTPPLGDRGSNVATTSAPGVLADLLVGVSLGDAGEVGGRITVGSGSSFNDPPSVDADQEGNFLFQIVAGYSLTGPLRLDASLNFSIESGASVAAGNNNQSGSLLNIGTNVRGFAELQPGELDLGFLANVQFLSQGQTIAAVDPDVNSTAYAFLLQAGAGPVWHVDLPAYGESARPIGNGTTIAAYGVVSIANNGADPNIDPDIDEDQSGGTSVIIPGVHAAADIEIFDWLHFRAGAQYNWGTGSTYQQVPNEDEDQTNGASNFGGFGWSSGIGLSHDTFRLDAVLASNFLTNGPFLVSGAASPMFQYVSASYMW